MRYLLFLFATLGAQTLQISLAGDALYWKPSGSFAYAVRNARTRMMSADYHWGARAKVALSLPVLRSTLSGSTTYLRTSESARTLGTNLNAGFEVGTAQSRAIATLGFQYWAVDVCLGHTWACTDAFAMAFGAGTRYADIHENQRIDGDATTGLVRYIYRGVGPGLSIGSDLGVWQGLHLQGRAAIWALVNRKRTRLTATALTTYPHLTTIAPASEIRLAVRYSYLEIGYELHHYWDAVDRIASFPAPMTPVWSQRQTRSTSFSGPYLRLEVCF